MAPPEAIGVRPEDKPYQVFVFILLIAIMFGASWFNWLKLSNSDNVYTEEKQHDMPQPHL